MAMRYPGGKGKTYQHVLNLLPPHTTYIETHVGADSVLRHKRPAAKSIAIDCDPAVLTWWRVKHPMLAQYHECDAVDFLLSYPFDGSEVIYCDPPYLPSTRKRARIYRHEYTSAHHERLLGVLRELPCRVVISGYPSALYEERLEGWNTRDFRAKAHDGLRHERLWFNYAAPAQLHDARFLGATFRQRELIRRRSQRLKDRILTLSIQERHCLADWLLSELGRAERS